MFNCVITLTIFFVTSWYQMWFVFVSLSLMCTYYQTVDVCVGTCVYVRACVCVIINNIHHGCYATISDNVINYCVFIISTILINKYTHFYRLLE